MTKKKSFFDKIKEADLLSFGSICICAVIITAAICVVSLFFEYRKRLILGLLFGLLFSIINFRLLKSAIDRSIYKEDDKKASAYVTFQYMIRYALKFVVLYIGFVSPLLHPAGVLAGLCSVSAAIYVLNLINTKKINKE